MVRERAQGRVACTGNSREMERAHLAGRTGNAARAKSRAQNRARPAARTLILVRGFTWGARLRVALPTPRASPNASLQTPRALALALTAILVAPSLACPFASA